MTTSIASFIQVGKEVELEFWDLQNEIVLKSCATDEIYFNLVDQKEFPALKNVTIKKTPWVFTYLRPS